LWFFKAGLSAVMVAGMVVLIPIGALARYPDDNGHHYGQLSNPGHHYGQLSNPGHHYGQLKHDQAPAANPPAAPTPSPGSHPVTLGSLVADVVSSGQHPTSGDASSIPDLPIVLPVQDSPSGQVRFEDSAPAHEQDWMLLLILPALLAVWLLVFARAALAASRRRRKSAA
jgi:hypothetical protein